MHAISDIKLLDQIRLHYQHLVDILADPQLDNSKRHLWQKEYSHLHGLLAHIDNVDKLVKELSMLQKQLIEANDSDMRALYQEEAEDITLKITKAEQELSILMVPPNEVDNRSVYVEIRAGTGGQEAALFVSDLLKMYTNYAVSMGWKAVVEATSFTDLGGLREVIMHIQGHNVYGHLKYESGVHRVQRVPATETQGRIHTSTATVAILPEADEVDVVINPGDLRIDLYRSSGAGGQHVNTTDSAVRITHIPSGVVVSCQDERSQHKNKAKAMKILQSRILAAKLEQQAAQMSKQRKELVGTGNRAEKVRTYNFPQNRVTDHNADITLKSLDFFMLGNMSQVIEALRTHEHTQRKQQFLLQFI